MSTNSPPEAVHPGDRGVAGVGVGVIAPARDGPPVRQVDGRGVTKFTVDRHVEKSFRAGRHGLLSGVR